MCWIMFVLAVVASQSLSHAAEKPNIIFILADDKWEASVAY